MTSPNESSPVQSSPKREEEKIAMSLKATVTYTVRPKTRYAIVRNYKEPWEEGAGGMTVGIEQFGEFDNVETAMRVAKQLAASWGGSVVQDPGCPAIADDPVPLEPGPVPPPPNAA